MELFYHYILGLLKENAGLRAQVFFPFLKVTFFFILASNLLGMFPYGYALTSQAIITFLFSCSIFLGTIFLGLRKHGINFFSLFFPSGSPAYMAFLLVPIEILSFVARPFSLGIRLFANMLAGHVLLKILSSFIIIGVFTVFDAEISLTAISNLFFKVTEKFVSGFGLTEFTLKSFEKGFESNLPPRLYYEEVIVTPSENLSFAEQLAYVLNNPAHIGQESESLKPLLLSSGSENFFDKVHGFLLQVFPKNPTDSLLVLKNYPEAYTSIYSQLPPKIQDSCYIALPLESFFKFLASPVVVLAKIALVGIQLALLAAFVVLELGIAFLQAYVFVILTTIYINDSLQLH